MPIAVAQWRKGDTLLSTLKPRSQQVDNTAVVRTWQMVVVAAFAVAALGVAAAVLLLGRGRSAGETTTVVVVAGQNSAEQAAQTARANLRAALPAAEAYYADNGTYVGLDATALKWIDAAVSDTLIVASAGASSYCLTDTVDSQTWSLAGPGAALSDFKNNATCS